MERIEADATPSEEWVQTLNATCNRLMTQYMNLLRSASSVTALDEEQSTTTLATGHHHSTSTALMTNKSNSVSSSVVSSSVTVGSTVSSGNHDPRAGGGHMVSMNDPPPPPLASDVAISTVQCQLAGENICVAAANIISLIRTLKLSLLLMDDDTIEAEEYIQVQYTTALTQQAIQQSIQLEQQYIQQLNNN